MAAWLITSIRPSQRLPGRLHRGLHGRGDRV